jgi:peptidoglycan hydrolase-like protein with peptidoglycan-binding domain
MNRVPDWSYWQGYLSYGQAKQMYDSGIRDIYFKLGGGDDGFYHDSRHDVSVANARSAGLRAHHYFFNGGDPAAAARQCAAWLNGMIQPGERFAWDIESPAWSNGQEAVAIDTLASLGYGPGGTDHYGSSSTLHNYPSAAQRGLDLWVAEYGNNDGRDHGVSTTGPWPKYRMHQYTSNGSVPGYGGRIDLSEDSGGSGSGTVQSGWGWINQTVLPISAIQHAINAAGYTPPLAEDNEPGPLTEAGIVWYQKKVGVDPDGIVGPITAGRMFGSANPSVDIGGNISERTTADVQAAINAMGYTPPLAVDDRFGPLTTAGVKWAQARFGIEVDGIVGPDTVAHLFNGGNRVQLEVDGIWGVLTTQQVQLDLHCEVDGIRGPDTVYHIQTLTGNPHPDKMWGPETAGYLQQYLINRGFDCGPTGADRDFGVNSTKALQRCINAGQFGN